MHRSAYVCAFARMSTYLYISLTYIHTHTRNLKHIMCLQLVLYLTHLQAGGVHALFFFFFSRAQSNLSNDKHLQAGGVHALVVVIRAGQSRSVSDTCDVSRRICSMIKDHAPNFAKSVSGKQKTPFLPNPHVHDNTPPPSQQS